MHVYELLTAAHRFYCKRIIGEKRLPGWTISVGNWTWGGSGKTPLCAWLASRLGKDSSAILSRGYKGGDEARMLRNKGFLVGVGKDRLASAEKMLETRESIQFWILDDGLQHWALSRNLEIICVDCLRPFGINGKLIPSGSLREIPEKALQRAHVVVLHNSNLIDEKKLNELDSFVRSALGANQVKVPIVHSAVRFTTTATALAESFDKAESHWVLFSGLGDNDAFFKSAMNLSIMLSRKVIKTVAFPDHHSYSSSDVDERIKVSNNGNEKITYLTTEKDLARCPFLADSPLFARSLPIEWIPIGGDVDAFDSVLKQFISQTH